MNAETIGAIPKRLRKSAVFVLGIIAGWAIFATIIYLFGPPEPGVEARAGIGAFSLYVVFVLATVMLARQSSSPEEAGDAR